MDIVDTQRDGDERQGREPVQRCISCLAPFLPYTSTVRGLKGMCLECRLRTPRPEKIHCRDCGAVLRLARRGRPRLRCDYCDREVRSARKRRERAASRAATG